MKTILVPTDFSPVSDNALNYALELAILFDSTIILLNAYTRPAAENYEVEPAYALSLGNNEASVYENEASYHYDLVSDKLARLKSEIYARAEKHLNIECVAEQGSPYDIILKIAQERKPDLIVMGLSTAAGKIKEHLIGSISLKIARNQPVPTFIVSEKVKYRKIQKISYACDLTNLEQTHLACAAKLFSRAFKAEIEIVNVEKPEERISDEKSYNNFFVEDILENVKHSIIHITGNDVAQELEDYFQLFKTDLIMISPKKHNLLHYLFHHSITNELAFHSGLPILAIH
jgi:nucleotide-binding universal stress UspA family protein